MNQGIRTVIYPVKDLAQAKTLYRTLLGVEPYGDEAYYVGFRVGDQEIGLDPHGHPQGTTGPVGYFHVSDIRQSLQALVDAGAHTARGHGCRLGEADCLCQRRRWEHHRASAVPVMARETQLFFWRKKRQPPLQKIYRHVRGKSKIGEVFFSGSE